MNKEEMYKSINKGVPNFVSIEIDTATLIRECSSDPKLFALEIGKIKKEYNEFLISIMGGTKSDQPFSLFQNLITSTNFKNSENKLFVSPKPFIRKLKKLLGVDLPSENFNDEELKSALLDKLSILNKVKTPQELRKIFPLIYEDYKFSFHAERRLIELRKKYGYNNPDFNALMKEQQRMYEKCGLDTRFDIFLYKQSQLYRNFIIRRQFVEDVYKHPIDLSRFEHLDKDKFELYLADRYLNEAETTENQEKKQKCIYYVATYLREHTINDEISITNEQRRKVTFEIIKRRYKKLLKNNPSLRPIDEPRENFTNYHLKHVENHLNKYYGYIEDWVLLPEGEDEDKALQRDLKTSDSLKHKFTHLSEEERRTLLEERLKKLREKQEFFQGTKPTIKLFGLETFNGYIAHVYDNGNVVLEKYYEDFASYIPAKDEAVYILNVNDFEELSKLPKMTLMKDDRVTRKIHVEGWQDRVKPFIEAPSTEESTNSVKRLILRVKTKKQ